MRKWWNSRREVGSWLVVMIAGGQVSGKRDSNPRPSAWEADALPTELLPHRRVMAICADVLW
jgi:hypothetical protein